VVATNRLTPHLCELATSSRIFTIAAAHRPPRSSAALIIHSVTPTSVLLGNGTSCVAPTLVPGGASNAGLASRVLELTVQPASSGPGMIIPGKTW